MQKVVIVDKNDNPIGEHEKEYAISHSLIRRIARIIVKNIKGEILIQLRSKGMTLSGGKWDQSAGGHVIPGETYSEAAKRELQEELGVVDSNLQEIAYFYYEKKHEGFISASFNKLFLCESNSAITLQDTEVAKTKWINPIKLKEDIEEHPEQYSTGLVLSLEKYLEWINRYK